MISTTWLEISIQTTSLGADAVSDILMRAGCGGTMISDKNDFCELTQTNESWLMPDPAILYSLPEVVTVTGWLEQDDTLPNRLESIKASLDQSHSSDLMGTLKMTVKSVNDEAWAETWKRFFKPIHITDHIVVKPEWEKYTPRDSERVIIIDPGMAFGTGQHESTALCMRLLEVYVNTGSTVIDVGTGSGILAICSALLGAANVLAIDVDMNAIMAAQDNIKLNHCTGVITVKEGNLINSVNHTYDIMVANISADIICNLVKDAHKVITPGGLFICSGIILERQKDVTQSLAAFGYTVTKILNDHDWVAIAARYG